MGGRLPSKRQQEAERKAARREAWRLVGRSKDCKLRHDGRQCLGCFVELLDHAVHERFSAPLAARVHSLILRVKVELELAQAQERS